ncbi:MAG: MFS transporter [Planctomycetia bacterium]|nr:MFS transporter [Planctomycetia bacterium]
MKNTTKTRLTEEKLSFGLKLGYGIGDIGSNIFIVTSGLFLLFFLTNILGVNPALAGLMLLFPKLWDVISDPIMGGISDVTNSRLGRRRPYLLAAAIPFGIIFFLMFLAPQYNSELSKALYVGLMFALGCTVFTIFNVPYSSMVAEMSNDYNERMSITSFRMIGSSVGVLLAGGLAMPLVEIGGGGEAGFRFMGIVFGAMITVFCFICFFGTRNAKTLPAKKKRLTFGEQVKIAFRNTPFKMLMLMYTFQSLGIGVLMAGLIYYVKYVMDLPEASMGIIFPILIVTAIIFIPVWVKIGVKIGKIKAYTIGLIILSIMLFSLFFTKSSQLYLFYVQIFLLGIGFSSFQLFPFSMLPDTIEFDELQSGMRREGVFSGIWSSAQKTAYSVGPSIVGFTLSLSGFANSEVQPEGVAMGVRIVFCLFTAFMILLSLLPFYKYDLTEERFEEIKLMIQQK